MTLIGTLDYSARAKRGVRNCGKKMLILRVKEKGRDSARNLGIANSRDA